VSSGGFAGPGFQGLAALDAGFAGGQAQFDQAAAGEQGQGVEAGQPAAPVEAGFGLKDWRSS
jgi:hypothetical protein